MEKHDVEASPGDRKQANSQEARKLSVQRWIQSLVHASECRDANCCQPSCQKMKRIVAHMKICKRKTKGECPFCRHLVAVFCCHAKHCQETKCNIPFCSRIKYKLKLMAAPCGPSTSLHSPLPCPKHHLHLKQNARRQQAAAGSIAVGVKPMCVHGVGSVPQRPNLRQMRQTLLQLLLIYSFYVHLMK